MAAARTVTLSRRRCRIRRSRRESAECVPGQSLAPARSRLRCTPTNHGHDQPSIPLAASRARSTQPVQRNVARFADQALKRGAFVGARDRRSAARPRRWWRPKPATPEALAAALGQVGDRHAVLPGPEVCAGGSGRAIVIDRVLCTGCYCVASRGCGAPQTAVTAWNRATLVARRRVACAQAGTECSVSAVGSARSRHRPMHDRLASAVVAGHIAPGRTWFLVDVDALGEVRPVFDIQPLDDGASGSPRRSPSPW